MSHNFSLCFSLLALNINSVVYTFFFLFYSLSKGLNSLTSTSTIFEGFFVNLFYLIFRLGGEAAEDCPLEAVEGKLLFLKLLQESCKRIIFSFFRASKVFNTNGTDFLSWLGSTFLVIGLLLTKRGVLLFFRWVSIHALISESTTFLRGVG